MLPPTDHKFEFINAYGNTSAFALQVLRRHGALEKMSLLSVGSLMSHLADYLAIFREVHHATLVKTCLPFTPEQSPAKFVLHQQDFFTLPSLDVDCIISHAAFHCFNDTRYGNEHSAEGIQKPYRAAAKLRQIVGEKRVPAVVSIAVNRDEGSFDNNTHLSHDKFIAAFEKAGFGLRDYFFDYLHAGGIPHQDEHFNVEYRRSRQLPESSGSPKDWVVGNYYFC
ncbi:MAG TPA: hypothetical protein VHX86_10960 [Tepidisphaeraceae bacterium]|jgi:hypothetical protein|nr:hypothetical protein [Tepidisphaeraceae bacterium]